MKFVIAEKPSVGAAIAAVIGANQKKNGYYEGNGYIVSWCFGHLVEPADAHLYDERYKRWAYDDLPIIPQPWQYVVTPDKKKQFTLLAGLMKDSRVDSLVCATDAGREGELIFRLVYEQAGCTKPFERLWISSMEDAAIREGFENLKPGTDYDKLFASAMCRSRADWIVGINGTRLFSVLYGGSLSVGRVQSPTLAMLVERDEQVRDFKKEKYYHARINPGGADAASIKFTTKEDAEQVQAACDKKQAVLRTLDTEEKKVNPPKLFDLTSLQRTANQLYGYTAQQTLDYVQALYEKKLATYPRTDSQYLTADMKQTVLAVITAIIGHIPFAKKVNAKSDVERVINDKRVNDHHAIIPTGEIITADLATLPEAERNVLYLIAARLLCATDEPHVYDAVTAVFDCQGHEFTAKGKTIKEDGWKRREQAFRDSLKEKPDEGGEDEKALPELAEGQGFDSVDAAVSEHTTTPPRQHTEDTLLSAMERAGNEDTDPDTEKKGLGTPATRASVIEKLVKKDFVRREKKQLIPTDKGKVLIRVLPDMLTSPKLTAEWENALTEIAKGNYSDTAFMKGIGELAWALVKENTAPTADCKDLFAVARPVVGKCPRCGGDVVEGKKNFYCPSQECRFSMWKDDRFWKDKKKALTADIATKLLADGKAHVSGLTSGKTGKKYDADVLLADTGKYVNYRLDFPDKKGG